MKQKVLSGVLGIFMLLVMFVPSIGATTKSFNWSFTMDLYAVYGNKNGEYHDLPAGDISVDGNIWTYAKSKTANATPLKVSVALWRNTLGFNTLVSSKVVTPSTVFESKKPVTIQVDGQKKDQYYLTFEKESLSDDGWDLKGSGTIKSVY